MSKVTSKLQVTIPKAVAVKYGIRPGDQVRWEELPRGVVMVRVSSGGEGRVGEGGVGPGALGSRGLTWSDFTPEERVALLEQGNRRIDEYQKGKRWKKSKDRGWTREDLYHDRGLSR